MNPSLSVRPNQRVERNDAICLYSRSGLARESSGSSVAYLGRDPEGSDHGPAGPPKVMKVWARSSSMWQSGEWKRSIALWIGGGRQGV